MVSRMYVSLFLFSLISPFFVTCFSIGSSLHGGKHCSLFDFEEKVLEKLVRIEHAMEINKNKMELWERDINNKIKLLDEDNDKRKSETRMMKNDIQTELENQKTVLEDIVNDYKTVLTSIVENSTMSFENVTREFVEESGVLLKDMDKMFNQTLQSVEDNLEYQQVASNNLKYIQQNTSLILQEFSNQHYQANKTMFEYIQQTISQASKKNRVAITMCTRTYTKYLGETLIPFTNIRTMSGINDTGRSNIRTTGKFTCETPGLYLISLAIETNTDKSFVRLYKNRDIIGFIFFSMLGTHHTNSMTVLENLTVGDSISVKPHKDMYIDGGVSSCLSVLQIC